MSVQYHRTRSNPRQQGHRWAVADREPRILDLDGVEHVGLQASERAYCKSVRKVSKVISRGGPQIDSRTPTTRRICLRLGLSSMICQRM